MKTKCYYCGYHTDPKGFCQSCVCWTYANSDNEVYQTKMTVILRGTKQYHVESNIKQNKTFVVTASKNKEVLTIDSLPFTPKNVKQKLSLYIMFS